MKVVEVPIIFTERERGKSKMSGNIVSEALFMVIRLAFQNGLRRRPRPIADNKKPPADDKKPVVMEKQQKQ